MYAVRLRESLLQLVRINTDVTVLESLEGLPASGTDIALVDAQGVDSTDLYDYCTTYRPDNICYIVDALNTATDTLASSLGITLVTVEDFPEWLRQNTHQGGTPVLTFWGVAPQYGTTTVALSVASILATVTGLNVGVLGLNLYEAGSWALHNPSHYLDDLKSFLRTKQLYPDQLTGHMDFLPSGVRYLCGNRNQALALHYSFEDIDHLIETARNAFDVVIIDAGSIINSASVVALLQGTIYAVITDRLYAQQMYLNHAQNIFRTLGIKSSDMLLVGNKMENPSGRILASYAKATGTVPLVSIPDIKKVAYYAEQQQDRLKSFMEDRSVRSEIRKVVDGITSRYGFPVLAGRK